MVAAPLAAGLTAPALALLNSESIAAVRVDIASERRVLWQALAAVRQQVPVAVATALACAIASKCSSPVGYAEVRCNLCDIQGILLARIRSRATTGPFRVDQDVRPPRPGKDNDVMRYRTLGRTGLRVSEVGCGGAPLGIPNYNEVWDPSAPDTTASVISALHHAVDLGYNYFDTAPSYGDGHSEELMGAALSGKRGQVYLASKTEWHAKDRDWVIARAESSLRRLRTDYLDVLQLHGGDYLPEDVDHILHGGPLDAYQQLKQAGKIRFIGITAEEPVTLRPFMETGLFDVIQIRYNIIYQNAWHNILPLARQLNLGVVLMRPLSSGIFQKLLRAARPDIDQYLDLHAIALNYVLSDPNISTAIVGMRRIAEVERNNAVSDAVEGRLDLDWLHERQVPAPDTEAPHG